MAMPWPASSESSRCTSAFVPDVDAAGGLVDDQQLRVGGQPLGEDDLLLVAAAQRAGLGVERGGLDLELARPGAGRGVLGA